METETAAGLLFCCPRPIPRQKTELNGGRIALLVLPLLLILFGLAHAAVRAGEAGDIVGATRFAQVAIVLLGFALVTTYAWVIVRSHRRNAAPRAPMSARASVNYSSGKCSALGTVSLENGALVFRGDAFDFRLPRRLVPEDRRARDFIGFSARSLRLPLPEETGRTTLWLTLFDGDRAAIEKVIDGLTDETEPVLPPMYRAESEVSVQGGWWIPVVFALTFAGVLVLRSRPDGWPGVLMAFLLGWMYGPGLIVLERSNQRSGERAFRRLQAKP